MAIPILYNLDLTKNQLLNALLQQIAGDHGSPVEGLIWWDSSAKVAKVYNGTTIQTFGIAGTGGDADTLDGLDSLYFLARANHTGTQTASTISNLASVVKAYRLDEFAVPTADISLNSHKLTNVTDPTNPQDAATKAYADLLRQGIADMLHDPVRVAVSSNVTISSPGTALDGVTLTSGDRVLLYAQTTTTQNGIYVFNGSGSAMTRAADADATGEVVDGSLVATAEGTHAGWLYIQTATPSGAIGSWSQVWIQYSTGSTYSADGTTLQLSGTTFSLITPVSVANGGTASGTAAGARTNLGAVGKYSALIGNASSTSFTITQATHGLAANAQLIVQLFDASTGAQILTDVSINNANGTVTITFTVAPASNAYRVNIVG